MNLPWQESLHFPFELACCAPEATCTNDATSACAAGDTAFDFLLKAGGNGSGFTASAAVVGNTMTLSGSDDGADNSAIGVYAAVDVPAGVEITVNVSFTGDGIDPTGCSVRISGPGACTPHVYDDETDSSPANIVETLVTGGKYYIGILVVAGPSATGCSFTATISFDDDVEFCRIVSGGPPPPPPPPGP